MEGSVMKRLGETHMQPGQTRQFPEANSSSAWKEIRTFTELILS